METCRLLITFANSLDPDHDQQNVGPDLDLNCLCRTHGFLKQFILKKSQHHEKLPRMQRAEHLSCFNQRAFSSKKYVKTVTVSLAPSSPLDSLYEIYYIETHLLHAIVE